MKKHSIRSFKGEKSASFPLEKKHISWNGKDLDLIWKRVVLVFWLQMLQFWFWSMLGKAAISLSEFEEKVSKFYNPLKWTSNQL
jgi:hypothetical protein